MTAAAAERGPILQEIRTAARHLVVYGAGNMAARALGFLMIPFYTHYLSPKDYGILEILDQSMAFFALLLNLGLTPALLRSHAAALTPEDKRKVISTANVFSLTTGLVTLALGFVFVRPLTALLFGAKVPTTYVLLALGSLVLSYMATPGRTYLRALEKSGVFAFMEGSGTLVLLSLNVWFIGGMRMGPVGMLWSSVIGNGLQFLMLAGWAFWRSGAGFMGESLRRMLRFGAPLVFANLGLFVLNFSDRFFLQHFASLDVVGLYALAYKFGYMMNVVAVQPFFTMWQSQMYKIYQTAGHERAFKEIFSLYSLGLLCVGLGLSAFSPEVIRLMVEPKFAAGQDVIPIVVLSYFFYGISFYAQLGMFLTDKTRPIGVIGAVTAALNLILNYFLIRSFGMMGAAYATLFSFMFLACANYWKSQQVLRMPLGFGRMLVAVATAMVCYLASRWLTPQPLAIAVMGKTAILIAFPAVMWKSGILDPGAAAILAAAGSRGTIVAWRMLGVTR
jgi:O-antigen/teichoic acid export membrane protein